MPVAFSAAPPGSRIRRAPRSSSLRFAADTDIQAKDSVDKTSYEKPEGWLAFNHSPARGLSIEGRRACESAGRCPSQRWTVNPIR